MISIDMDLPKSCFECRFLVVGRCAAEEHNHINGAFIGDTSRRAKECPLKPLEAPVTASIDLGGEFTAEKKKTAETEKNGYIRKEMLLDSNGIRYTCDETLERAMANALFREWIKWFEGGTG